MSMMDQERDIEVPTLEADDRLFTSTGDVWRANACLNFGDPEVGYVGGFKMASDRLVEHVASTGNDQDFLVYPIVFAYRQYLELRLKGVLRDASLLLGEPAPDPKLMGRHGLLPLWTKLRPLIERVFLDDSLQLDLIGDRLAEFEAIDPDSFAFRYATSKRGDLSLPTDLRQVNLVGLQKVVEKIASTLDGADTGVDVYLDAKAEMAEYHAEVVAEYSADPAAEYAAERPDY
jgi:hypothetical protein